MNILILVVKGFIIGIGKIIPGVSGAMLAMSLGLYELCLDAITNFFKNIKSNLILLSSMGFGILLAIVFGSKIIAFLLINFYLPTILLFLGLIIGGMFSFYKTLRTYAFCLQNFISFLVCFLFVIFLSIVTINQDASLSIHSIFCLYFILGLIDAATMIIPGVSGTAIFMLLGVYQHILVMFAKLDSIQNIISNLNILIPFGLGVGIGVILVSVIMNFLLKKKKDITSYGILGFQTAALFVIFGKTLSRSYNVWEIVIGCLLFIIGIKIGKSLE